MHTVHKPSALVIQFLLPTSNSPKFRPLTSQFLPLAITISQMDISKTQFGGLGLAKRGREVERLQIQFPTRIFHPMLRRSSKRLNVVLKSMCGRLTLNATRKSSRNILSKLTCVSWVGGTATVPVSPVVGPGSGNDGELDEVPFRRPKNNLTAPSMSPVVYKSRPILQVSERMDRCIFSYRADVRLQGQPLRTLSNCLGIYLRFPKMTGIILSLRAIRTLLVLSSGNKSSRVSCEMKWRTSEWKS